MNAIRTTRSRQSRLPRIAGIAMFVVAVLIMPGGCSDDPQSSAPTPEKTQAEKPVSGSTEGTMPEAADPFDLQAPAVRRELAVERVVKGAGVALAGSDKLKDVIAKAQVKLIEPDEVAGPAADALKQMRNEDAFIPGEKIVDIIPPAPYAEGEYLPEDMQLVLPLTAEQCEGATAHNVGVAHLSPYGPIYIDGYYDEMRSAVVIKVPHLSSFLSFRRDPQKEIAAAIASEASKRAWAMIDETRKQLEGQLMESAEEYLKNQAFDKLDSGIKRKMLLGVIKHREDLGNLFAASGRQDAVGFCQSFQLLMGKIIIDNTPASKLRDVLEAVTNNTETIAAVSQAGGRAAGGDYWAAIEIIGKSYSKTTPIYQYTVQAAAIIDAGWSMLKDDALEEFYKEYKAGTFVPERVSGRMDILMYLKRKFPKKGGGKMTDSEAVKFVVDNFAQRQTHEKKAAELKVQLKSIHDWYRKHPLIRSAIEKRFNKPNTADCFRRFLRIIDAAQNHLVGMGIYRKPWGPKGEFGPQNEMRDMINGFRDGGASGFNRVLKEIQRRLANPLDLKGYSGFWILDESKRDTVSLRKKSNIVGRELVVSAKRTGANGYTGSLELEDSVKDQSAPEGETKFKKYTYEASGTISWDAPPKVVPNGTNWEVKFKLSFKEDCTLGWGEAGRSIHMHLGQMVFPKDLQGKRSNYAYCYASLWRSSANRMRVRSEDDMATGEAQHCAAGDGKPWNAALPFQFIAMPDTYKRTSEQCIMLFEAYTPAGTFRETYTYRWVKELPENLKSELHQQISRANFKGFRTGKLDLSGAVKAEAVEPAKPTKTVAGSKVLMTGLRHVPERLVAMKEARFEVVVVNCPRVPSFVWSFGDSSPPRTTSWTTVPDCQYRYFRPGTFTLTVKMRDKNNYAKGYVAVENMERPGLRLSKVVISR